MSWIRPRPQFPVSGRVNRPHFEHAVTMLRSFSSRPALRDPFVGILLRDDVHELLAADVIRQQMTTGAHPLDMSGRLEHLARNIASLQERAPDHLPRIRGIILAVESMANDRAHPVGADHELGFDLGAMGESEDDAFASLLDPDEAMVQMDQAAIQRARQSIQQVGPVKRIVRRAVTGRIFSPVIEFEEFTGLHVPRVDARGRIGHGGDLFAEPDGNKRPCCVRGNIYGCADFAQGGRRFKDFCLNAEAGERMRRG